MVKAKIFKKLNPDLLTDSIVEVRHTLNMPYEIFIGKVYEVLHKDGYDYTSPSSIEPASELNEQKTQIALNFNALQPIFKKNGVTIKLTPASIIFNCHKDYIGWGKYYPLIKAVLSKIDGLGLIQKYNRIGLRYINSLEGINIYEKLIPGVRIEIPDCKTSSTAFATVIEDDNFNINLRIQNNVKLKNQDDHVSILDIDVYILNQDGIEFDKIFKLIDGAHSKEKEIFTKVLKGDFIKSLKPEY